MQSNGLLGAIYSRTDVLSLLNGSVKIVFRMEFTESIIRQRVMDVVSQIINEKSDSSGLPIIANSLVIGVYVEEKACGTEELMLCDGTCQPTQEIACNDVPDCSDYYDESNCPGKSVSCSFEQPCGYELSTSDSGYQWVLNSGNTLTEGTGPSYDHTYMNSSGHYYYTEWCSSSCKHGTITRIISPYYVTRTQACLSFYYSMNGHPTEMGSLYLYSLDHLKQETLLWTRENPDSVDRTGEWRQVLLDIEPGSYQFFFASFLNDESELGDKAIDDILVEEGTCTGLPVCDEESIYCAAQGECLDSVRKPLCNGRFDCPDEVDERNCPGMLYSSTFEAGSNLSSYSLSSASSGSKFYHWNIIDGKTPISPKGTYFDNTFGNELGHYATALPIGVLETTEATLSIERIIEANEYVCLQFAYQMNYEGSVAGSSSTIKVQTRLVAGGNPTLLWSHEGNAGRDWLHESYSMPLGDSAYQIEFVAVRGAGEGIVVSLDDITLMEGLCPCADPGRRQCPDRTCIPNEWFCDGEEDCVSGADEMHCPACMVGDFQCKDKSCVRGGDSIVCDGTYDCADGFDEESCAVIDTCATEDCVKLKHPDGLFEVCSSGWSNSLNDKICTYLYKGPAISHGSTQAAPTSNEFLTLNPESDQGFITRFSKTSSCPGNSVIKVSCASPVCGRRHPTLASYIIGGTETSEQGRWPWLAELKFQGIHICGATLLSPNWLVTAAHCVNRGRENVPHLLTVSLGTTEVAPGQVNSIEREVKRVVLHPGYMHVYNGSDMALLFIQQPINYTDIIMPACLANPEDEYSPRSYCYLTGWGKTETEGSNLFPNVLQEAKFKLRDSQSCNKTWSGVIKDNMVCAGYQTGSIRSCQGDSGGPLVCLDKYQRWSLVGITSFGPSGCLVENFQDDVFTRVSHFIQWINDIINFQFTCQNGNVINDEDRLCDGADDCGDNSDEVESCLRSVECSFEARNFCGYRLGNWKIASGLASSVGGLVNTGPSFDQTSGLADGKHKYAYTDSNDSILTSPPYGNPSTSCLQFFYYLSYGSNIHVIKSSGEPIQVVSGSAEGWQVAQVELPVGDYSVSFRAEIFEESYVAIDDVTTNLGPCSGPCPSDMFKCHSSSVCIHLKGVCDGLSQCADASDEDDCSSADEVSCSFDEAYGCGLRQRDNDNSNWDIRYLVNGMQPGPSAGHGDSDIENDFSYLIFNPPEAHALARISWPVKMAVPSCMAFWYYMDGTDVGSLQVYSRENLIWQQFGSHGQEWMQVRVPLDAGEGVDFIAQASSTLSGFITVDDVVVVEGSCPARSRCDTISEIQCYDRCLNSSTRCNRAVDCFDLSDETGCGWEIDCNFDALCSSYQITKAFGGYIWEWRSIDKYLSVPMPEGDWGAYTDLTSAPFSLTQLSCLTFKYQLEGISSGNSELRVLLIEPVIKRESVLWRRSSSATLWTTGHVTLSPVDQPLVTVSFKALYGGNDGTTLSLDEIALIPGSCSLPACPGGFLCPYEEKCIAAGEQCDGVVHCSGSFDERNCGDLADKIDCDFDDDFCQWKVSREDLSLLRTAGSTPLPNTGPSNDHTQNNWLGFYIYLSSTENPGTAHLTSPSLQLTSDHCLSFYYYMAGANIGILNLTSSDTSGTRSLVNIDGPQSSPIWHKVKVTLSAADELVLRFIFTSTGRYAHSSIDDITLRAGACNCTGDYQCAESRECFDSVVKCDFRFQCIDNSDETNCGDVCPGDGIRCKTDGDCYPKEEICKSTPLQKCIEPDVVLDCNCNSTYQFTCDQGFCYHKDTFCNGHPDCDDSSDEPSGCAENCLVGTVACGDKTHCILNDFWCDDYPDCPDGSDELPGCVPVVAGGSGGPGVQDCHGNNFICHDLSQVLSRSSYCDQQIDCADGSDEPLQCECCSGEFACLSGDLCLDESSQCDGVYDCPDMSDEVLCNCSATEFRCDAGLCLDARQVCDGSVDCHDWSDEITCSCSTEEFSCDNGRCLEASLKCNGRDDCLDNSDERGCACSSNEVRCEPVSNSQCIPQHWKCDGFLDCTSGSDEINCGTCPEYSCTDYQCINYSSVCDGVIHCADGRDESECFSQSANMLINIQRSDGQSTKNYTLCYDGWNADWSTNMCIKLGYKGILTTRIVPVNGLLGPWLKMNSTAGNLELSNFKHVSQCDSQYALALECKAKDCGESSKLHVKSYIVGGNIVETESDWPWMVAIYFAGEYVGAGVHIGDGWLLTAAHLFCVRRYQNGSWSNERRDKNPHMVSVELTSLLRTSSSRRNISKVIIHSGFSNVPTLKNDLALIKLAAHVEYPSVCLFSEEHIEGLCYTAGWGSVDGKDTAVKSLRDTRVELLKDSRCVAEWNSGGFSIFYPSTMLCAGGDGQPSTCFGDSGGPLMCADVSTGSWFLRGIVSFGENECLSLEKPNVFTEVIFYLNWIEEIRISDLT
ncbi:MAM and LDL-receptor class A domain-containing protein 1-like [Watersipora subatra]|uniref:MAM and LDL-receptor class A domain-containing protein 1-like n=1 Tax=Watersipora subatra TaxID=2589382 RepID=UPI00355BE967